MGYPKQTNGSESLRDDSVTSEDPPAMVDASTTLDDLETQLATALRTAPPLRYNWKNYVYTDGSYKQLTSHKASPIDAECDAPGISRHRIPFSMVPLLPTGNHIGILVIGDHYRSNRIKSLLEPSYMYTISMLTNPAAWFARKLDSSQGALRCHLHDDYNTRSPRSSLSSADAYLCIVYCSHAF